MMKRFACRPGSILLPISALPISTLPISALLVIALLASACGDHRAAAPAEAPATQAPPAAVSGTAPEDTGETPALDYAMLNPAAPMEGVVTGGQPTDADLDKLAARGFRTVVSLRTAGEVDEAAEQAKIESLGMRFVQVPIAGPADLTEANARKLAGLLDDAAQRPLLLHCGSSNRVGALVALASFYADGASPEDALRLGKAAGLSRLEPAVRERLGLEPGAQP